MTTANEVHTHAHGDEPKNRIDAEAVLKFLSAKKNMVVLDAATGHGDTALNVAPHVKEVVAIDASEKAIEKCREKVAQSGITNIVPLLMPVEKIAFPDATFDAITCRFATHHFNDIVEALSEMSRILKPNGAVVIADRLSADEGELREFIQTIGKLRDSTFTTIHTMEEWQSMLAKVNLKVAGEMRFKEKTDITKWLDRSPLNETEKQRMHDAFANASDAVKKYYEIVFDNGKAVEYTDDRIVFRAVLQESVKAPG